MNAASLAIYLWIALGGALGSVGRFALSGLVADRAGSLDHRVQRTVGIDPHDADLVGVLIDAKQGLDDEAERVLKQRLSVRDTENAVRGLAGAKGGGKQGKSAARRGSTDPNVRRLEADLAETLGAAVAIEHGPKGGRVVIRYNGLEELEGILAHIK